MAKKKVKSYKKGGPSKTDPKKKVKKEAKFLYNTLTDPGGAVIDAVTTAPDTNSRGTVRTTRSMQLEGARALKKPKSENRQGTVRSRKMGGFADPVGRMNTFKKGGKLKKAKKRKY